MRRARTWRDPPGMTTQADLTDKVAIVTGGTSGIGLATVRRLLAVGCNVMVASTDRRADDATVAGLDDERAAFHHSDVGDEADVRSLVAATLARFGRIDHLFNNAG